MSFPTSLVGTVFTSTQVSLGAASGSDPIVFTESTLLSDQKVFGTALGPNATATVIAMTTDATGTPTITVRIANSGTLADGQSITGIIVGNSATAFLIYGQVLGSTSYVYVTSQAAGQPGVGKTASVAAEADNVVYTACYCAGTAILTDRGEVPVEELLPGDMLVTAAGERRPVRWIGHRRYAGRFLAANAALQPVRFRAGSLGAACPARDLLVSPAHAMFLDGVLVPAHLLVNGATVVRERGWAEVSYHHVELDSHDVILAEGAPSESFVDDDSRGMFHNAAEWAAANPGHLRPATVFCAPLVTEGPELDAIRARLAAVAPAVAA